MMKLKNISIAVIAIVFVVSLMAIDNGWPAIICAIVSGLCLYVILHRNGWIYDPERDEAE